MPTDPRTGSGCAVAVRNLVTGLTSLGAEVQLIQPRWSVPNFTLRRLLFNESLRLADFSRFDVTLGIDLDGYARPDTRPPHVANVKGVLGDVTHFENGWTRRSMEVQARLEARHVQRADKVITISRYCAAALRRCYDFHGPVTVVPEAIDLDAWRTLFRESGASPDPNRFTVLSVCRFFPRKRIEVLLQAVSLALPHVPDLRVRIIGDGPEKQKLRRLWAELRLQNCVEWLGSVPRRQLARELTSAHCFCLPSVQEGFGIAFLEAMAARLPIVAAKAAAVPEVIPDALLCPPDDAQSFADALLALHDSPDLRERLAAAGELRVQRYSLPVVTATLLRELDTVSRGEGR